MSLASVRQEIADRVNDADLGFTVKPRPGKIARKGDGWVQVQRVRPSADSFVSTEAELALVLLVGTETDPAAADNAIDTTASAVIDALSELPASGLVLEPGLVPVSGSSFFALIVTLTMEV